MKKNAKSLFMIRQGDVLLVAEPIHEGAKSVPLDAERGLVLAEGEVTGHAHRIPHRHATGAAAAFRTEEDARFVRVMGPAPAPLCHEEHKTRCASCEADGRFVIATARIAADYTAAGYLCTEHAAASDAPVVSLAEPGVTDVPAGNYGVTIHAEYVPGELPRNAAD